MGYIQVEVNSEEVIDRLADEEIEKEFISRKRESDVCADYEKLYYALRDRDIDKAIEIINPIMDLYIGRSV